MTSVEYPTGELSRPYEFLSPTSFEEMRTCRLRAAFKVLGKGGHSADGSAALHLGNVCHRVMEVAVQDRTLLSDLWEDSFESVWDAEIAREVAKMEARGGHHPVPAERWPDYEVKRARLRRVARRIRAILVDLPVESSVVPEAKLEAFEGRLRGVADLVIRPPGPHRMLDYKSGGVIDDASQTPRERYVRQLHLYSALEAASTGTWPERLHLFPLRGSPVEIDVDPDAATGLANEALSILAEFNSACPGPQPAAPAPENCLDCPYSAQCPAFWLASESWGEGICAVKGEVTRTAASDFNGVSLEVLRESGPLVDKKTLLRNIDPVEHPAVLNVTVGTTVAVTGLLQEANRSSYRLPAWGRFHIEKPEESQSPMPRETGD